MEKRSQESKCYCITGITVGIQDSDIKGQGNVKEPDLQTKFKKSKVVTDLIHDFNMKYIKGTRKLGYKQNSNDSPAHYNLEDKIDEDRSIDEDRNVDENRNIDNDCKECETMKIKFKTILDKIRDLFSTG
ncbi:hypothetical protein GLOIN_2v1775890 [Rhizophagus irregularis DAOM 181602=DAOM 197198]|uniref:Uncharacterized protein n=1 Tax=Rhizophagus irregularis (strain DAOM 181602 / DAOM 197198 / MUCL 43194) TaxID=747089 RepID=A0A2P4PYE9_RHIID|nr:hypothetical protein GLOIN_2v1775890 [Rhizophagus irregularis DAOM 181602=DAOM 197198]POG70419.1 hypothetical protein GLOIN_2v1775890 [Rhizophagus irregularis DAOM 181602=DAOM 197198]|eukprot:XP_025177285.1 hypothetical protein GLOIN_2v1775890 [Rhizophagus irregularis DAOM 181602=DAOM 197198]